MHDASIYQPLHLLEAQPHHISVSPTYIHLPSQDSAFYLVNIAISIPSEHYSIYSSELPVMSGEELLYRPRRRPIPSEHYGISSSELTVMSEEELPYRPRRRRSDETMSTIDNMPAPPYGLEDAYELQWRHDLSPE